jgi:transposase-like protein
MGGKMARNRYSPEHIFGCFRETEVLLSKVSTVPEICRKIGIAEQTYYRWRKKYHSLSVAQAKRLKEVDKENTRLRKLVADFSLDKAILKEVAEGKY